MNYTVIPKSIVNFQTGNSKPVDIYVWATIKCCSNHETNISHVTEEKLSLLTGLDERTIRRVIKRLKDAGYLTVQTTIKEDADRWFIKRNSYYIKPANKNYFFLDNSFFKRNYPAKIAGFLRYSITTIYTYRSKLKNRSLCRDNFEEEVMKIGSFAG